MEQEPYDPQQYYYTGSGQFYSPQMVRSLSEAGQTSSQGSGGGPAGSAVAGPSGGGFSPNFSPSITESAEASGVSLGIQGANALLGALTAGELAIPYVGWVAAAASALFQLFDDLFNGSSDTPPTPRKLLHGRHPLYPMILAIQGGLIPTEGSAASGLQRPLAKNDDIEPAAGPIGAFTTGLEAAGTAEALGGGPEDPAADVVAGAIIIGGGTVAIYKAYQFYQSGHDEDCDKEWEAARETCRELLSRRNPPRGLTGGYKNIEDCARGFVTEECGGNILPERP